MTHPFSLYILLALKKESTVEKPMNREAIRKYINDNFNVDISLKTITDNIKAIDNNCAGYFEVKHVGNNGYYLANNGTQFTLGQITCLMDAVFSSSEITSEEAVLINNQLIKLLNEDNIKSLQKVAKHVLKPKIYPTVVKENVFNNVEILVKGIDKNKAIKFKHPLFPEFGTMSPYYLFNKNGHYYVVCSVFASVKNPNSSVKFEDQLYIFRVNHLTNVKATNEKRVPIDNAGLHGRLFQLQKLMSKRNTIREGRVLYTKSSMTVVFKDPYIKYEIEDVFGINASIEQKNGIYEAIIKNDEDSLINFVLKFANEIDVIKPASFRTKLIQKANILMNKYRDVDPQSHIA